MASDAQRPADAYYEMQSILNPKWFLRPPPKQGTVVVVVGKDGIDTEWAMSFEVAAALKPHVLACPGLRWVSSTPYTPNRETQP